jgi:hypothetical protein
MGSRGPDHDPRQRRAILIAVCIALMAVIASVSGLNVAQPELAVEFDAAQSTVTPERGIVWRSSHRIPLWPSTSGSHLPTS